MGRSLTYKQKSYVTNGSHKLRVLENEIQPANVQHYGEKKRSKIVVRCRKCAAINRLAFDYLNRDRRNGWRLKR